MSFEFATAARVLFGEGMANDIPRVAGESGSRVLVLTGARPGRNQTTLDALANEGLRPVVFAVDREPTTTLVLGAVEQARDAACDAVVSIGGGSVIDAGKAVAALLTNDGELLDYLEVVGAGREIVNRPAPFIAVPTTSGAGAEVTRNAVIESSDHRVKVSMRSPLMLPRVAVVDPLLTHSAPPSVTASTGLDALTQLIEAFVSSKANPLTDGFCREGMMRAARSLKRAYENGSNARAREDMSLAALLGGLALANAKLGAAHGFAGPLGGMYPAPHGAVCARLLSGVIEANVRALESRDSGPPSLARYAEIARIVTGDANATRGMGVDWIQSLCEALSVPGLGEYGLAEEDVPTVVDKARASSSMKGNPIELTCEELTGLLTQAM